MTPTVNRTQVTLAVPRHRDYRAPAPAGAPYLETTVVETRYAQHDAQRYIVNRVSESASFEIVNDGSLTIHDLCARSSRAERRASCLTRASITTMVRPSSDSRSDSSGTSGRWCEPNLWC